MKCYLYYPDDERYESFVVLTSAEETRLRFYDATPVRSTWTPMSVKSLREVDDLESALPSDFPRLNSATPVFSERAWTVLGPLLKLNVEALPILGPDGRAYYAIHVLSLVSGVIDLELSDCSVNKIINRVSSVRNYVLKEAAIPSAPIFKLEETRGLSVFVSEEFREVVESASLVGLKFIPVETY
jgi:hypothetical protein